MYSPREEKRKSRLDEGDGRGGGDLFISTGKGGGEKAPSWNKKNAGHREKVEKRGDESLYSLKLSRPRHQKGKKGKGGLSVPGGGQNPQKPRGKGEPERSLG